MGRPPVFDDEPPGRESRRLEIDLSRFGEIGGRQAVEGHDVRIFEPAHEVREVVGRDAAASADAAPGWVRGRWGRVGTWQRGAVADARHHRAWRAGGDSRLVGGRPAPFVVPTKGSLCETPRHLPNPLILAFSLGEKGPNSHCEKRCPAPSPGMVSLLPPGEEGPNSCRDERRRAPSPGMGEETDSRIPSSSPSPLGRRDRTRTATSAVRPPRLGMGEGADSRITLNLAFSPGEKGLNSHRDERGRACSHWDGKGNRTGSPIASGGVPQGSHGRAGASRLP